MRVLILVFLCLSLDTYAQEFLLKPKFILDIETGKLLQNDIHVKDGIIVRVGKNLSSKTATIISMPSKILLPGLMDTHVHLIGNTDLQGYENISEKMYIALGYANMDGETSTGGEPREIPDSTLTFWTNFQVTDKFGWGVGLMQQGESNISNNKPGLVLPDYTRVDFAAYYDISEDLSIQFNIENLGDKLYFPHSHSTHQASVGEPLNFRLSLRRNF